MVALWVQMCKQRSLLCMAEAVFAQVDFLDFRQKSLILFHIQVSMYLACQKGLQVEEEFKGTNDNVIHVMLPLLCYHKSH